MEIEVVKRPSTYTAPTSFNGLVANAIAADTDEFDVVANYAYAATKAANLDYWYDLADLPNVNFAKPWWRQNYINVATAHGVFFTVIGDLNLSVIGRTMLLYYNKRIAEQYGATLEQDGYGIIPQDAHNNMAVMRNIKNPAMVGAMLELLNAETWKTVRPAYCEETVKFRYMRDSESGQIFDIIVDSVHFDYATIYNAALDGHGTPYWIELFHSRNQLASTMAANRGTILARIKQLDRKFIERAEE